MRTQALASSSLIPIALSTWLGAALAGGVGVGLYSDFSRAAALTPVIDTALPNQSVEALYGEMYAAFNRAYEAFEPLYPLFKQIAAR